MVTDRPLRVAWVLVACMGLAVTVPLDLWLLFGAKLPVLMAYILIVYGWPALMLVLAMRVWGWLSPLFLFVGLLPLVMAPGYTGLDPIPWLGGLAYFAALVIAISEGPLEALDRWHERRSH